MALSLGLEWPWLLAAVAVGTVLLLAWWARRSAASTTQATIPLAHADAVRRLPRYRELVRRQRRLCLISLVGAVLLVGGAGIAVARPHTTRTAPPEEGPLDVMLCLDASQPVDSLNVDLLRQVRRTLDEEDGDRVGMTIWDGAAVQVFPFTDDYDYVRGQLRRAEGAFIGQTPDFFAGVEQPDAGTALVGDGIVSCVRRFGRPDVSRTRVALVTSDNSPQGSPAYSLPAAAALALEQRVRLVGFATSSLGDPSRMQARREFATAAVGTGGLFSVVGPGDGGPAIRDVLTATDQARRPERSGTTTDDVPLVGGLPAVAGLVLLGAGWAGRRGAR